MDNRFYKPPQSSTILPNPIDEDENNPVQQPERSRVKSLEELGITPIEMNTQNNNNNNGRVKSLEELGITPIKMERPADERVVSEKRGEKTPEQESLRATDRLLQFGRGVAEVPAVLADLGSKYISAPAQDLKGKVVETAGKAAGLVSESLGKNLKESAEDDYRTAEEMRNTTYTQDTHNKFNEWAGKDITPNDMTGNFINSAGNFSFPIPGTGAFGGITAKVATSQGVKATAKQVAGGLGRNTAIGAGGAAALEGTKPFRYFEEDTMGRHVEDFLQTVVGMSLSDKGLSTAKKAILSKTSKSLEGIIEHSNGLVKQEASEALEKPSMVGKVLSLGAKPNHEVNALAKKYDIQLPFQVALRGKAQEFVSNTFLKSLFTAKVYDDIIINADKDMINAVKEKIAQVSPEQISGDIASARTREFLNEENLVIDNQVNKLYNENAFPKLKETDRHVPENTADFIRSSLKNNLELSAAVPGPAAKPVASYLKDIGEKWGFIPPKNSLKEFEDSPDFLRKVIEAFQSTSPEVSVRDMISQLRTTYQYTKHQKEIPGVANLYNGLVGALQKDIESTANKEFLAEWRTANQYYKQEKVDRIKTSMAKSIMEGEVPKEAFSYMDAVPEIRQLQKIIGGSANGREILGELKRAKLDQVLSSKIIDASGTILYGQLSNMFLRNPEKQALLKELLGESYDGMKELSKIAQEFVKSGKEFGNPSKTMLSSRDDQGIKDMFKIGLNLIGSIGAGALSHGMVGMAEGPLAIRSLSKLVSNKKYIDAALKYSKANNQKEKATLANRLSRIAQHILVDEPMKYPQSFMSLHKDNSRDVIDNEKNKQK